MHSAYAPSLVLDSNSAAKTVRHVFYLEALSNQLLLISLKRVKSIYLSACGLKYIVNWHAQFVFS